MKTVHDYAHALYELATELKPNQVAPAIDALLTEITSTGHRDYIAQLPSAFAQVADEAEGIAHVTVASARPLAPAELKRIEGYAAKTFTLEHVHLDPIVDATILGGIRLIWRDQVADASLASNLHKLSTMIGNS